jgi:hypothetical protein
MDLISLIYSANEINLISFMTNVSAFTVVHVFYKTWTSDEIEMTYMYSQTNLICFLWSPDLIT